MRIAFAAIPKPEVEEIDTTRAGRLRRAAPPPPPIDEAVQGFPTTRTTTSPCRACQRAAAFVTTEKPDLWVAHTNLWISKHAGLSEAVDASAPGIRLLESNDDVIKQINI